MGSPRIIRNCKTACNKKKKTTIFNTRNTGNCRRFIHAGKIVKFYWDQVENFEFQEVQEEHCVYIGVEKKIVYFLG